MPKVATQYLETDPWAIIEKGFHPDRQEVSESIFSLGNEYMGARGYFEEGYSGASMIGSYLNGVFEEDDIHHPCTFKGMATRMTFLVNTVDWLYTRITLDGETLDLARSKISGFTRRLDMRTGVLTREFVWHVGGKKLKVQFLRFLSMAAAQFGAQRVVFEPLNFSGSVDIVSGLDSSVRQYSAGVNLWHTLRQSQIDGTCAILSATKRSGHRVFSAFSLRSEVPLNGRLVEREQLIGQAFTLDLQQGAVRSFDKLVFVQGERNPKVDTEKVWSNGLAKARKAFVTTFDAALATHTAYWDHVWRTIDVSIDGDPENEQGIRYCIFQLHQTYHGVDPSLNISAKGLTGESYWGATWWDTETYCLPFYMFNNPQAAKNLLGYRYATLPGARQRAKQLDCVGARYPMATIDGTEIVGVWQHGDLEIHVSAAVGYGIWHYAHVTGDKEFLYGRGIEMLLEICRYYASRGQYSAKTGEFGFWFVMGADEFHMGVHNNTYTNVMAKKCFEWALDTVAEMRRKAPEQLDRVVKKIKLTPAELRDWRRKARAMRVLQDLRTGLIEQHDGYFDMPHLDLSKVPPTDFPLYHHWAYVRIFRWDMSKQPDALLLPFFFSHEYSDKVKKVNYEYYEPRCSHESSLSPGVFSILAAELGMHRKAYDYSLHAARLDLDDYNRNTNEGLHTTSMAAAWLLLVYGFGGMRSDGPQLSFKPSLPRKWNSYSFRIVHCGSVLSVKVDKKNVTFQIHDGPDLPIEVFGKRQVVGRDGLILPLPANRRG